MKLWLHKVRHWEYWPSYIINVPIYVLWVYYAVRARSLFFFNSCNPKIKNGGMMSESKMEIYNLIPQDYYPKTIFIERSRDLENIISLLEKKSVLFPFIVKPDIGLRGSAVKIVSSLGELKKYHSSASFDYLVQDLIPYSNEIGIFYVRFPKEDKGKITGIVKKEFVIIEGNGKSTVEKLIRDTPRYAFQIERIKMEFGDRFEEVLLKGEKLNLVPYGNHVRGAKFVDCSHLITENLNEKIDNICQTIPEFYFGRIDLMYQSWEDLEKGKNFSIVEVNGAGSEPTHIYDPSHSIYFAWKELARHFSMMYKVSVQNHERGYGYLSFREGYREFCIYRLQNRKFEKLT